MNLDEARAHVETLIEKKETPLELPGGVSLEDLVALVGQVAQEEIRSRLTVDGMSEDTLQQVVEQTAMRTALICLYASANQVDDPADADVALGITSDVITQVMRGLLAGRPISISISVDDD